MKVARAIIAGGGTGGHLFPGIAVAREILRRNEKAEILFVGAERGIESRLVPKEGFQLRVLPLGGFKNVGLGKRFWSMIATFKGIFSARQILREFNPGIVIGVGGYASFPMMTAAILGGCPRIVMEQNSIPGLANRMVARWVDYAAITDPKTKSTFGDRAVVTGNPIRPQFKSIAPKTHQPPFTVLVFGGSQGAQAINRAVRESLSFLKDWTGKLKFVHQTGEKQVEEIRQAFADAGFDSDVRAFFDNFHQQYVAADLIISRAGATTVAEIKASGRAAILIPLPTAADDHQTKNAQAMVADNAAVMIPNSELSGERLAKAIRSMLSNLGELTAMENNARRTAVLDSELRIVDLAERAIEKRGARV